MTFPKAQSLLFLALSGLLLVSMDDHFTVLPNPLWLDLHVITSTELRDLNCLINVISPGFVDTGLTSMTSSQPVIQDALRRSANALIDPDSLPPSCKYAPRSFQ